MRSDFWKFSIFYHTYPISLPYSRESMRYEYDRFIFWKVGQCVENLTLSFCIHGGSRFIKDVDLRIFVENTREIHPLPLSSRKRFSSFELSSELLLVSVLEIIYELDSKRHWSRFFHFIHIELLCCVTHRNRLSCFKKIIRLVLRHISNQIPPRFKIGILYISSSYPDFSRTAIIEPKKKFDECTLPGSIDSYYRNLLSRIDGKIYLMEYFSVFSRIWKWDILELDERSLGWRKHQRIFWYDKFIFHVLHHKELIYVKIVLILHHKRSKKPSEIVLESDDKSIKENECSDEYLVVVHWIYKDECRYYYSYLWGKCSKGKEIMSLSVSFLLLMQEWSYYLFYLIYEEIKVSAELHIYYGIRLSENSLKVIVTAFDFSSHGIYVPVGPRWVKLSQKLRQSEESYKHSDYRLEEKECDKYRDDRKCWIEYRELRIEVIPETEDVFLDSLEKSSILRIFKLIQIERRFFSDKTQRDKLIDFSESDLVIVSIYYPDEARYYKRRHQYYRQNEYRPMIDWTTSGYLRQFVYDYRLWSSWYVGEHHIEKSADIKDYHVSLEVFPEEAVQTSKVPEETLCSRYEFLQFVHFDEIKKIRLRK